MESADESETIRRDKCVSIDERQFESVGETSQNSNITFESPFFDNHVITSSSFDNFDIEQSNNQHISSGYVTPTYVPERTRPNAFLPMKNTGKGPVGNFYAEINWGNGFERWHLTRFSTPMDGSCLFHAISNSFFSPYHTETLKGVHVPRHQMVARLRKELSKKLASKINTSDNAPTHYDILSDGNTRVFAEMVPEFKLEYMQEQLKSSVPIGYGYMEFIGNALDKDIYILEASRADIYVTDELSFTIKGNRSSVVLYYMNGHYELVGIKCPDGSFDTHFSPDHTFIRFLYNRVCQITGV